MSYLSSLTEIRESLVLDTSVLINLNACTYGKDILLAVPNQIVVAENVAVELRRGKNGESAFLNDLIDGAVIAVVNFTDEEYQIFGELTSGGDSLDDGEAASIAIAINRKFFPVIDEKKGRSRASTLMEMQEPCWSLDLLRHPLVQSQLGNEVTFEALYRALRDGRMRIPEEAVDDVIAVIGTERAVHCKSLPGYKQRFGVKVQPAM